MAKLDITHACGHTVTHQIAGRVADRDYKVSREEGRDCRECYHAKLGARAAEENTDLPSLTGSDKQISWAEQIRAAAAKNLREVRASAINLRETDPVLADKAIAIIDATLAETSASVWIDARYKNFDAGWVRMQIEKA